jgi:hypothetical protein
MRLRLLIVGALAVGAWAEAPTTAIKGVVQSRVSVNAESKNVDRNVPVVLRLFDREFGGTLLFEERQTVDVDDAGIFVAVVGSATKGGIPARITDQYSSVWGEYALASEAFINSVNPRQQIAYRSTDIRTDFTVTIPIMTTLCYTCGGSWPYLQGWWNIPYTPYTSGYNVWERGLACAGSPGYRVDTRPFLCSRTY